MLFKFLNRKPKPIARVVRIARLEWTKEDEGGARHFFKSPTFGKIKAFCDEQLIKLMLSGRACDEYRKGWIDCQRQYEAFGGTEEPMEDSTARTSMQLDDGK